MALTDEQQIKRCQTPQGLFRVAATDAEARLARGEAQAWCRTCERWRWEDGRCPLFVEGEPEE